MIETIKYIYVLNNLEYMRAHRLTPLEASLEETHGSIVNQISWFSRKHVYQLNVNIMSGVINEPPLKGRRHGENKYVLNFQGLLFMGLKCLNNITNLCANREGEGEFDKYTPACHQPRRLGVSCFPTHGNYSHHL